MLKIVTSCIGILLTIIFIGNLTAFPVLAEENSHKITQEDMVYFLMTDRFNNGDSSNDVNTNKKDIKAYHGGDFQGVIDKLDYIKDLGFTTVWISPVVKNEAFGYHGYWAYDFYKTEDHFGTIEKLKELVSKAHSKDMKIIVDLVVNHTGYRHPWVSDPKYADWFHHNGKIINWNDQNEIENGDLAGLPDFNTENPEVKKYLFDMAKWWIQQTGFDGYRLDTTRHVPREFLKEFVQFIKKDYPDFYFIGEVFSSDINYVADYQRAGLDGITDFPMYYAINDIFGGVKPATQLANVITQGNAYQNRYLMGTFIDNHDVPRFTNQLTAFKEEKLKQALTFIMTYTGIPVLYYGTEIGMKGGADPDNRRDMDWSMRSPITDYVKKLTDIRKSNKALSHGDIKLVKVTNDFLCYSRSFEDKTVFVAYNVSGKAKSFEIDIKLQSGSKSGILSDLLETEDINIKNNKAVLSMTPRQVKVYQAKEESGVTLIYIVLTTALLVAIVIIAIIVIKRKNSRK